MEQQERQAAEAIYRRYSAAMKHRALRCVDSPEDAEDVVSSCWVSLLGHLPKLMGMEERALSTYLMRTVQNRAWDMLRQRQRRQGYAAALNETLTRAENGVDPAVIAEMHDALEHLVEGLPDIQRRVVLMRLAGCPPRQIAAQMQLPVERVRRYWRRAVSRMRNKG